MELKKEIKEEIRKRLEAAWNINRHHIPTKFFDELCVCAEFYLHECFARRQNNRVLAQGFVSGYGYCLQKRGVLSLFARLEVCDEIIRICNAFLRSMKSDNPNLCACIVCEHYGLKDREKNIKCKFCAYREGENK